MRQQENVKNTTSGTATSATTSTAQASNVGEYTEVSGFLDSINLAKYRDRFIENGIEDEETILELND